MKERKLMCFGFVLGLAIIGLGSVSAQANTLSDKAPDKVVTSFDLGTEASWIKYEEPDIMEESGYMVGLVGAFSAHFPQRFMAKVEGYVGFGQVDYDSVSTGSIDEINDFMGEVRVLGGYDFYVSEATRITPFVGFGYRYLADELGGEVSTTGAVGYDRESNYYYIPVGAETTTELGDGWSVGFSAEYDFFISGRQKSHLEDIASGLNTLENDQDEGWGARGSIRIAKETEKFKVFFEPFVRYWEIDQSDVQAVTFGGTPIGIVGYEPENKSTEVGAKLGVSF